VPTSGPALKTLRLSWQIPTKRVDGSVISPSELTGFEIYYTSELNGASETIALDGGQVDSYTFKNLPPDIYHISMVAIDGARLRSELSEIVSVDIR
jgi:hypothetical protein